MALQPNDDEPPRKKQRTNPSDLIVSEIFDTHTIKLTWTISNFTLQPDVLDSQSFCVGMVWWSISMLKTTDGIAFFLALDDLEDPTSAHCALHVINQKHLSYSKAPPSFFHTYEPGESRGFDPLLQPSDLTNGNLENDTIILSFVVSTHNVLSDEMTKFFKAKRDDSMTLLSERDDSTATLKWEIHNWSKVAVQRLSSETFKFWRFVVVAVPNDNLLVRVYYTVPPFLAFISVKMINQQNQTKSLVKKPFHHFWARADIFCSYSLIPTAKLAEGFLQNDTLVFEIAFSTEMHMTPEIAAFMLGQSVDTTTAYKWDPQVLFHEHMIPLGDNVYTSDNISMSMDDSRYPRSIVQFQYDPLHLLHKSMYFELTLIRTSQEIGIGLAPIGYVNSMTGWRDRSIGYHGDDGKVFDDHSKSAFAHYVETYNDGDTVGLLYDTKTGRITFFKNGRQACAQDGALFVRKDEELYPCVTASLCDVFTVNFGKQLVNNPQLWVGYIDLISPMRKNMFTTLVKREFSDVAIKSS
jgi:hypothetical protein